MHCRTPLTDDRHTPFCSQGCRDRDLLQWLGEGHRIPGPLATDDGEEIIPNGLDSGPDRPL